MTPSVRGIRDRYVETGYRISKITRYAKTVKRGESPLMVWTRETGIFPVAVAERRWPPIWKAARGRVVMITSRVGYRMPWRRAGTLALSEGKIVDSQEKKRQNEATKAN